MKRKASEVRELEEKAYQANRHSAKTRGSSAELATKTTIAEARESGTPAYPEDLRAMKTREVEEASESRTIAPETVE